MGEIDVASHTLELLKRLNGKMDSCGLELGDLKMRIASVEDHLSGLTVSNAGITHRLDRIEGRLDRIERRIDLRDGNA